MLLYKTPVALFHSRSLELESRWTKRCMPVIAIVNEKGGTGKTTLSTNLAVAFARDQTVFLLDADAQGVPETGLKARRGRCSTCMSGRRNQGN